MVVTVSCVAACGSDDSREVRPLRLRRRGRLAPPPLTNETHRRYEEGGKYLTKRNTFFDFVDCAHHLADQGWTTRGDATRVRLSFFYSYSCNLPHLHVVV